MCFVDLQAYPDKFDHTLLIRGDGTNTACGSNEVGQCRIPPLSEGITYTAVAAGSEHTVLSLSGHIPGGCRHMGLTVFSSKIVHIKTLAARCFGKQIFDATPAARADAAVATTIQSKLAKWLRDNYTTSKREGHYHPGYLYPVPCRKIASEQGPAMPMRRSRARPTPRERDPKQAGPISCQNI